MTPQQTAAVLAKCAAFDQRTIGEADILAWHEVIGRFDLADCLQAVKTHYAEESRRAMPADIRRLAIPIRDRRNEQAARQDRYALEVGATDRSAAVTQLIREVAAALPQPDSHKRAVDRARLERGGPAPKLVKTKAETRPKAKPDYPAPGSDEVAAMAHRYLVDGYTPTQVSEILAVSKRWCERTLAKFSGRAA